MIFIIIADVSAHIMSFCFPFSLTFSHPFIIPCPPSPSKHLTLSCPPPGPPPSFPDPSSLHPLSHTCSLHAFLCMAGLIEYLNKLINHGRPAKTDRSREVMFIKATHPTLTLQFCFLNPHLQFIVLNPHIPSPLLPFLPPSSQISLPLPRLYSYTHSFSIYDFT